MSVPSPAATSIEGSGTVGNGVFQLVSQPPPVPALGPAALLVLGLLLAAAGVRARPGR